MGGCATKPKVLKEDDPSDAMAPAPAPAPSTSPRAPPRKEEDTVVKEAAVENDAKDQEEGAVVDHDSATKNSSLGNLFKENQEGKDSGAETVKVPDVSEVTTKEVEKTIPEDSSLKKEEEKKIEEEEGAKEKMRAATEEEEEQEVVRELAEKKPDEVNVDIPEEKNLDQIKPRVANPDEKKPETQQLQQEQEEQEKKETDESLKPAIVHPPPPPPPIAADQEKFATPKEKPEETYATTAKEEKKPEAEQIQGEKQQTLNK